MILPGTDYETKTTFWTDFTIADAFGPDAVQDTWERAFAEWKDNPVYLTELSMIMNHKCWQHYTSNKPLSLLYENLYWRTDEFALDTLKGDDLTYYWQTMD